MSKDCKYYQCNPCMASDHQQTEQEDMQQSSYIITHLKHENESLHQQMRQMQNRLAEVEFELSQAKQNQAKTQKTPTRQYDCNFIGSTSIDNQQNYTSTISSPVYSTSTYIQSSSNDYNTYTTSSNNHQFTTTSFSQPLSSQLINSANSSVNSFADELGFTSLAARPDFYRQKSLSTSDLSLLKDFKNDDLELTQFTDFFNLSPYNGDDVRIDDFKLDDLNAAGDDSILNGNWLNKFRCTNEQNDANRAIDGEGSNSTLEAKHGSNSPEHSLTPFSQDQQNTRPMTGGSTNNSTNVGIDGTWSEDLISMFVTTKDGDVVVGSNFVETLEEGQASTSKTVANIQHNRRGRRPILSNTQAPNRRFQCLTCGQWFRDKYNLNHHTIVHTGEKPYACPICTRAFSRINLRRQHLEMEHGVEVEMTVQRRARAARQNILLEKGLVKQKKPVTKRQRPKDPEQPTSGVPSNCGSADYPFNNTYMN